MPIRWGRVFFLAFLVFVMLTFIQMPAQGEPLCRLAPTSEISSVDQAKCLLRQPEIFGQVGEELDGLPSPFDRLLSLRTIDLDQGTFRRYLQAKGIREEDVGGSLDEPVSRTNNGSPSAELARYFIIHDTSTPNFGNDPFPSNINESNWTFNDLSRWLRGNPLAHVFINRVGQSITVLDFKTPWRSTRREADEHCGRNRCKGLFLAVEMVQPRRCQPRAGQTQCSGTFNDASAPEPGFTEAQLDRLALVYIAASVRRGKWMIPAFHVTLDKGVEPGTHDDPQNFDLSRWSNRLNVILSEIQISNEPQVNFNFPVPADTSKERELRLWSTYYRVHQAQENSSENSIPLRNSEGNPLGVSLSQEDWCQAALQGTVRVSRRDGFATTYNFSGRGAVEQASCRQFFTSLSEDTIRKLHRNLFEPTTSPFGLGVEGYILVPYRTIAVDRNVIPVGTLTYIPEARGTEIIMPSGERVVHDGYFFSADVGAAIRGNHIDTFLGIATSNPFAHVRSRESETFTAYIINNPTIREALENLHEG
jgi:3D (Asp-Asp-Asp) domain-containing protein